MANLWSYIESKEDQEQKSRQCENENHPATFVDHEGRCSKYHRCPDAGRKGCKAALQIGGVIH